MEEKKLKKIGLRDRYRAGKNRRQLGNRHYGVVVALLALMIIIILAASYGILDMMERRAHSSA